MQCKDIPERPILAFLDRIAPQWADICWTGERDITGAFPVGTHPNLKRAKLAEMIKKGLIGGCACGCRGDFEIKPKGAALLAAMPVPAPAPMPNWIVALGEDWKPKLVTLPALIGPEGMAELADVTGKRTGDDLIDGIMVLAVATARGRISANAAARHLGLALEDTRDLCIHYVNIRPFDL